MEKTLKCEGGSQANLFKVVDNARNPKLKCEVTKTQREEVHTARKRQSQDSCRHSGYRTRPVYLAVLRMDV
ncbi:hypothetical protein VULLAG_LOCUS19598 [Vulpes lagopus]